MFNPIPRPTKRPVAKAPEPEAEPMYKPIPRPTKRPVAKAPEPEAEPAYKPIPRPTKRPIAKAPEPVAKVPSIFAITDDEMSSIIEYERARRESILERLREHEIQQEERKKQVAIASEEVRKLIEEIVEASHEGAIYMIRKNWKGKAKYMKKLDDLRKKWPFSEVEWNGCYPKGVHTITFAGPLPKYKDHLGYD